MGAGGGVKADLRAGEEQGNGALGFLADTLAIGIQMQAGRAAICTVFPLTCVVELIHALTADTVVKRGDAWLIGEQTIDVEAGLSTHEDFAVRNGRHAEFDEALDAVAAGVLFACIEFVAQVGGVVGTQGSWAYRGTVGAAADGWAVDPYDTGARLRSVAGDRWGHASDGEFLRTARDCVGG